MKICIATDCFPPKIGGVENHSYYLANELTKQGHNVTVLTHKLPFSDSTSEINHTENLFKSIQLRGYVFNIAGHDVAFDVSMLKQISNLIKENQFDIIHGQGEGSLISLGAIWSAKRQGFPTILTKHSMNALRPPLFKFFTSLTLPRLIDQWADGVIGVSQASLDDIKIKGLSNRLRVIGNGIDPFIFKPDQLNRNNLRKWLGYSETDIIGGYIGRLNKKKGIDTLIEVVIEIIKKIPDFKFLFVGSGPMKNKIISLTKYFPNSIKYLDAKPYYKINQYYNILDIFTLASHGESFGICLIEAMAIGVVPVALAKYGTKEIIENNKDGFLTDTIDDFFAKIMLLAQNADLRKTLADQAKVKVDSRFTWSKIAKHTTDFYKYIIDMNQNSSK